MKYYFMVHKESLPNSLESASMRNAYWAANSEAEQGVLHNIEGVERRR